MAKSRRGKRARSRTKHKPAAAPEASAQNVISSRERKQAERAEQFRQEYAYVVRDLRRVFILAGAMFLLLIMLNVWLQ